MCWRYEVGIVLSMLSIEKGCSGEVITDHVINYVNFKKFTPPWRVEEWSNQPYTCIAIGLKQSKDGGPQIIREKETVGVGGG
jgi:hypothetical protein